MINRVYYNIFWIRRVYMTGISLKDAWAGSILAGTSALMLGNTVLAAPMHDKTTALVSMGVAALSATLAGLGFTGSFSLSSTQNTAVAPPAVAKPVPALG
jgi:hypothetical protein